MRLDAEAGAPRKFDRSDTEASKTSQGQAVIALATKASHGPRARRVSNDFHVEALRPQGAESCLRRWEGFAAAMGSALASSTLGSIPHVICSLPWQGS